MVSIDGYLNETTRHANVILPPCSPLERAHYDLALNAFAVEHTAKWVDPPLARDPGAREDGDIALDLVLRLRIGGGPLESVRALLGRGAQRLRPETIVDLALRIGPYGMLRGGLSVAALRDKPHGVHLGPLRPRLPAMLETATAVIVAFDGATALATASAHSAAGVTLVESVAAMPAA